MRSQDQSTTPTPPPWNEGDCIRECALLYLDDPDDKDTMRRLGRLIYNLAVETTRLPFEVSMTHAADSGRSRPGIPT
jgi:hypothetical protein